MPELPRVQRPQDRDPTVIENLCGVLRRASRPAIAYRSLGLVVFALGLGSPALALDVVETTDYPGASGFSTHAASIGTLDPGMNTVAGTLDGVCDLVSCNGSSAGDTQDSLILFIPSVHQAESITVTTANVLGPAGFSASFSLRSPSSTLISEPFLVIDGTTTNLVTTPLEPGIYSLSVFGQQSTQPGPYTMDWLVSIQIVEGSDLLFKDGFETGNLLPWSATIEN